MNDMFFDSIQQLIFYHNGKLGPEATAMMVGTPDSTGTLPLKYLLDKALNALNSKIKPSFSEKLQLIKKIRLLTFVHEHFASSTETESSNSFQNYVEVSEQDFHDDQGILYYKTIIKALAVCPFATPTTALMDNFMRRFLSENEAVRNECIRYYDNINSIPTNTTNTDTDDDDDNDMRSPAVVTDETRRKINYALHEVLNVSSCHNSIQHEKKHGELFLTNLTTAVHFLLKIFPDAARMRIKSAGEVFPANTESKLVSTEYDGDEETPLCLAILNGFFWDSSFTFAGMTSKFRGPVGNLAETAPEMVCEKHLQSSLYPFMLAASIVDRRESIEQLEEAVDYDGGVGSKNGITEAQNPGIFRLSTIYALLRLTPELLVVDVVTNI